MFRILECIVDYSEDSLYTTGSNFSLDLLFTSFKSLLEAQNYIQTNLYEANKSEWEDLYSYDEDDDTIKITINKISDYEFNIINSQADMCCRMTKYKIVEI